MKHSSPCLTTKKTPSHYLLVYRLLSGLLVEVAPGNRHDDVLQQQQQQAWRSHDNSGARWNEPAISNCARKLDLVRRWYHEALSSLESHKQARMPLMRACALSAKSPKVGLAA